MVSNPSPSSQLKFCSVLFSISCTCAVPSCLKEFLLCCCLCYSLECLFLCILSCPAASGLSHHCCHNSITFSERTILTFSSICSRILHYPLTFIELVWRFFLCGKVNLFSASPCTMLSSFGLFPSVLLMGCKDWHVNGITCFLKCHEIYL